MHLRAKRLTPVAQAFKDFLASEGAALIDQIVPLRQKAASPRARAGADLIARALRAVG